MKDIKIALEWFLNPDHLPFIVGIQSGIYLQNGFDVKLIVPHEHYDGFDALEKGLIDLHVNEPIHLFEHYKEGIKSLGCYFETRGGIMIKKSSVEKLYSNEKITITTPAANNVTNKIGFEILKRYAQKEGFRLDEGNVEFIQTDFYHLKNLKSGKFDAAWLCFYNFEGIEAKEENFDNLFIDQFLSPYPHFSALEIITNEKILNEKKENIEEFLTITKSIISDLPKDIERTKECYYGYSKEVKTDLMDKIIEDTIMRFYFDFSANAQKWKELYKLLEDFGFVKLRAEKYDKIWN